MLNRMIYNTDGILDTNGYKVDFCPMILDKMVCPLDYSGE